MSRLRLPRLTLLKKVVGASITLIVVAALFVWLRSPPDPLYKGKRLSAYLSEASPRSPMALGPRPSQAAVQKLRNEEMRAGRDAEEAIKALGPGALPLLAAWLQSDPALRLRLRKMASTPGSNCTWLLRFNWVTFDPHMAALDALAIIPERGVPLVPILWKEVLANHAPAAERLVRILEALPPEENRRLARENTDLHQLYIGSPTNQITAAAAEVLASLARVNPPTDCESVLRRLFPFRSQRFTNLRYAIQQLDPDGFLQNLLYLECGTASEKPAAALFFRDAPRASARVVPLLVSNLVQTSSANLLQNSCEALGAYGTNAASALPVLSNLLGPRRANVAKAASNAIERIRGR